MQKNQILQESSLKRLQTTQLKSSQGRGRDLFYYAHIPRPYKNKQKTPQSKLKRKEKIR